jgi:hypothetical protein
LIVALAFDYVAAAAPFPRAPLNLFMFRGVRTHGVQVMSTIKIGVREFRERIATFLESDTQVAVTRRGETLGVYVPTLRKRPNTAEISELKAAADRLASALSDADEEEMVAGFKQLRRGKRSSR